MGVHLARLKIKPQDVANNYESIETKVLQLLAGKISLPAYISDHIDLTLANYMVILT